MKHQPIPRPYDDAFSLGQVKVANIRRRIAGETLAKAAPDVITTEEINPAWLAMRIHQINEAVAEMRHAEAIIATHGVTA